jgi:hypothetical protein
MGTINDLFLKNRKMACNGSWFFHRRPWWEKARCKLVEAVAMKVNSKLTIRQVFEEENA